MWTLRKLQNIQAALILAILVTLSDLVLDGTLAAGSLGSSDKNNVREALPQDFHQYFIAKYTNLSQIIDQNQHCVCNDNDNNSPDNLKVKSEPSDKCKASWKEVAGLNVSSLVSVCPQILYHIDNPECCSNNKTTGESHKGSTKPSSGEVWGFGILFVTLISLSSLVGVSVLPLMGKDFYKHLLTGMIGLAVGSLTGSAVFHLIPQAFKLNETDKEHTYLNISLVICGGVWMFFMVERILKFIMDYKDRKDRKWKHEKISSVLSSTPENSTLSMLVDHKNAMNGEGGSDSRSSTSTAMCSPQPTTGVIYESQEQAIKSSFGHQEKPRHSHNGHDHNVKFEQGKDSVIATVAWMIIFGDGLHNFIDGLSIGAAFNESILTGVSISVAVLCEELPHELGDFAVLLNAGMSMRQALLYNFLSACTCYFGLGFGILLGEVEASSYIFALAGGMFLYISLVDMVPEMNEIAEETSKVSVWKGVKVLILQNLGLFTGITVLYVLAKYQENIQF